jgi:hypothetical protein
MKKFDALMNEVQCINSAWGYVGVFDALVYMKANSNEYKGTQVYRELQAFMAEGARMFATEEA